MSRRLGIWAAAAMIGFGGKAVAEAPEALSLMFTAEERAAIMAATLGRGPVTGEDAEHAPTEPPPPPPDLHLSSLLYLSPREWTAWINDRPVTPGVATSEFVVGAVGPDFIELILTRPRGKRVRLAPHQTYRHDLEAVVEGR